MNPPERSISELIAELEARGITKEQIAAYTQEAQDRRAREEASNAESPESGEQSAYAERDKAALNDKGALKPCEACGGDFAPLGLRSFLQLVDDPGIMRRNTGTEMALAMCANCGLMRFHAVSLLEMDEDELDAAG